MRKWTDKVTVEQAYLTTFEYLLRRWEYYPSRTVSDELSDMALLPDGDSADPAMRPEFLEALQAVLDAEAESGRYSRADQKLG